MLYEVSFAMSFGNQSDALSVQNLAIETAGNESPSIVCDSNGLYTVSAALRFASSDVRDSLVGSLVAAKNTAYPGFIKHHICNHDTGGACVDLVTDRWSGVS